MRNACKSRVEGVRPRSLTQSGHDAHQTLIAPSQSNHRSVTEFECQSYYVTGTLADGASVCSRKSSLIPTGSPSEPHPTAGCFWHALVPFVCNPRSTRLHPRRTAGRDRDHRDPHRASASCGPVRTRGCPTQRLLQQPAADRVGLPLVHECQEVSACRVLHRGVEHGNREASPE